MNPSTERFTNDAEELRSCLTAPDGEHLARIAGATKAKISATGRGFALVDEDVADLDLSSADLRNANFARTRMFRTRLDGATLDDARLMVPGLERASFRGCSMRRVYMHALAAQVCDFRGAVLDDIPDATGALFHGCNFEGASLRSAHLAGAAFYQCNLSGARFEGANLSEVSFIECNLAGAVLTGALLDNMSIVRSTVRNADLTACSGSAVSLKSVTDAAGLRVDGAKLPALALTNVCAPGLSAAGLYSPGASVTECDLSDAEFPGAELTECLVRGSSLGHANFASATLSGGKFARVRAPDATFRGGHLQNLTVIDSTAPRSCFDGADARAIVIRDTDLSGAQLVGTNLYRAQLTGDPPDRMCLAGANLSGAVLIQAYLTADMRGACLDRAECAYARLNQSDLTGARCVGANFFQASAVKVRVADADLSGLAPPFFGDRIEGLDTATLDPKTRRFLERLAGLLAEEARGST